MSLLYNFENCDLKINAVYGKKIVEEMKQKVELQKADKIKKLSDLLDYFDIKHTLNEEELCYELKDYTEDMYYIDGVEEFFDIVAKYLDYDKKYIIVAKWETGEKEKWVFLNGKRQVVKQICKWADEEQEVERTETIDTDREVVISNKNIADIQKVIDYIEEKTRANFLKLGIEGNYIEYKLIINNCQYAIISKIAGEYILNIGNIKELERGNIVFEITRHIDTNELQKVVYNAFSYTNKNNDIIKDTNFRIIKNEG